MLIKDTEQRRRVAAPTEFGMNPAVAERMQSFGLDPRDLADRIHREASANAGVRLRRPPTSSAKPVVMEMSIDYRDVTLREVLQHTAMESYEVGFIQEEVAPSVFVDVAQGRDLLEDSTEERREVADDASSLGQLPEAQSNILSVDFNCEGHGLEDFQARRDVNLAPAVITVARLVEKTAKKAKRQHEIRVKRALQTAANYDATTQRALGGGFNWNGGASANPIGDMQAVLAAMFAPPTHALMSLEAWQGVQLSDELRAILASQLNNKGLLDPITFGLYFGIPRVIVDEQRYTPLGATAQSRLYDSDKLCLLNVSANPLMRTFLRNYMLRQGAAGWVTLPWYDEALGTQGADRVKVSCDNDLVVVDSTYGGIITGLRA